MVGLEPGRERAPGEWAGSDPDRPGRFAQFVLMVVSVLVAVLLAILVETDQPTELAPEEVSDPAPLLDGFGSVAE